MKSAASAPAARKSSSGRAPAAAFACSAANLCRFASGNQRKAGWPSRDRSTIPSASISMTRFLSRVYASTVFGSSARTLFWNSSGCFSVSFSVPPMSPV